MNARQRLCHFCGLVINDIRADGVHNLQTGWVMNRAKGAHAIVMSKRHDVWAHHWCAVNKSHGSYNQTDLFPR